MEKKRLIEDGGKGTVPSLTYTHFRGWHRLPDHFQQCLLNDLKVRVTYTTQLEHYVKYYSMFTVCISTPWLCAQPSSCDNCFSSPAIGFFEHSCFNFIRFLETYYSKG